MRVKNKSKSESESQTSNIGFNEVKKVDPNILIHTHGNLLILNWQNVDHENILKKLICLT